MSQLIRFACAFTVVLGTFSAAAQYNPYADSSRKRPKRVTAPTPRDHSASPPKKKGAVVKQSGKRATVPIAQQAPQNMASSTAAQPVGDDSSQTEEDAMADRVAKLERELDTMRLMLARAGIQGDVETLDFAQREELGRLETRLQQLRADHTALVQAIDRGLEPELVMSNLQTLEAEMAATQGEIAEIRMAADDERTSLTSQLEENEARIASLESDIAALKADHSQEKSETDRTDDGEKTPLERLNGLLPVEVFAFGDFLYVIREDAPDNFEIGQLDLDLTQDLINEVTINASIVYDNESESFGVAAFNVDGRLIGSNNTHIRLSKRIQSMGVILGRFDVPFGIDYMEYASIYRRLVTGPLAVDATHGEWNDLGGQLYLIARRINAVLYGVNGYGYETSEMDAAGNEVVFNHPTAMALGGRVGLLPLEEVELGGSLAMFFNSDAEVTQLLAGADAAVQAMDLTFKGEYIYARQGMESSPRMSTHGMYGGMVYDFKPVFVAARYSMVWPHDAQNEKQLSLGMGVQVFENGEIRFEYSSDLESGGSMAFIQLAGGTAWQPSGMRR